MKLAELITSLPAEILLEPKRIVRPDWVGHIPFLYYLLNEYKPSLYVELGVFHGDSYCAACQITKANNLPTKLVGIDCWMGDIHIGNYGDQVLEDLKKHHDPLYADISRLEKGFFNDKLSLFADSEIELLHIDGEHTYEAVKRDFETWLPKVSKDKGLILFHDTDVFGRDDFGVWKLWDELISSGYHGIRFTHCNGLGVISVSPIENLPASLQQIFKLSPKEAETFFALFAKLGKRFEVEAWSEINMAQLKQNQNAVIHQSQDSNLKEQVDELMKKIQTQRERIQRLLSEKDSLKKKNAVLTQKLTQPKKSWFKRMF